MAAIKPITSVISGIFSYTTYLTAQGVAGGSTLTVKNIGSFAIDQILLIGELGPEGSEIIKSHNSSVPSGTTVTLLSNLVRTHPIFTKVTVLIYDQIEISHAVTAAGSKTLLNTTLGNGLVAIPADALEARWDDTEYSSGFYFVRYKNSISGVFSEYTDAIPYTGFADNTLGVAINYALKRNKLKTFNDNVDYEFCLDEANECLREITGKLKRWSKLQTFDAILGQVLRGQFSVSLPSDIWENETNKSILGIRVGSDENLDFRTKTQWENDLKGINRTQVRTEASTGATSLAVDNSYDFPDSGSLDIYVSGTKQVITYTAITRDDEDGGTAAFTGIPASGDGSITATIPVDTNVWSPGVSEGKPVRYTVFGGVVYILPLPSTTYANRNVYADYYTGPTSVDSDGDALDLFRYDAIRHWLAWAIRSQLEKSRGERNFRDADYLQYVQIVKDYIRAEVPAHSLKRAPKINGIVYGSTRRGVGK